MNRSEVFADLGAMLREEAACYRELLAACREHRQALVGGPGERFEASLQRQLLAMAECRRAGAARLAATGRLAAELQLGEPCSTDRLIASLPPGEGEELARPHAELRELSADIATANARNRALAEHHLDLLQGDFSSLRKMALEAAGRDAEAGSDGTGSILSFRA